MKKRIKLWLWKKFLMLLQALLWRADEWVHAQQNEIRRETRKHEQLYARASLPAVPGTATDQHGRLSTLPAARRVVHEGRRDRAETGSATARIGPMADPSNPAKDTSISRAALSNASNPAQTLTAFRREPLVIPKPAARGYRLNRSSARVPEKSSAVPPEDPAGVVAFEPKHPRRQPESFSAFLMRRAGVAPASKAEARRHRERMHASDFDRRFACIS